MLPLVKSCCQVEVISSSSPSSQIIRDTSQVIPASTSSLEDEEDKEDEEDEADDEDGMAGVGVLAFWMRRAKKFFFFF